MTQKESKGAVWVFDAARLDAALEAYEAEALAAYPQQQERIRTTVLAMRDFLYSDPAAPLRMKLGGD